MALDLVSATSDGVFALLDAAIGADVAEVTTNPKPIDPKDTSERQFVIIGDIDSTNEGGKHEQLERITVQIIVVYRGRQRSKLHALMHLVRDTLEYATPAIDGVEFGEIAWTGSAASPAGADGVTHAGAVEFDLFVEPA
jgi:hypothetical protein